MRVLKTTEPTFDRSLAELRADLLPEKLLFALDAEDKVRIVHEIIQDVRQNGDESLCTLTAKFDGVDLAPAQLKVSSQCMKEAYDRLGPDLRSAIELACRNVREYQEHLKVYQTRGLSRPGVELRTRYRPLDRVGIYVPGGEAPLPSTLIMTAVPAQVAGVKQIVVASPPRYQNDVHPVILAVCHMLGITEVYRIGGAQAIAAMGLGTQTVARVDKIVGPGNVYIQLAKKALFGVVDIESFAGASEIVVLADAEANPTYIASDLIGQAEHPGSAMLVTPSSDLAGRVSHEMDRLLARSSRAEQTRKSIDRYCAGVVTRTLDEGIDLVNRLAPEHLSIQTIRADEIAEQCLFAGAIFIGAFTTEALGDYLAGPSHVLPTGGTARFFSPLNVMDFMRHTSVIKYDLAALKKVYPALRALAEAEHLPGHLLSATVRVED
jgi:histidinol dehydrogenase